MTYKAFGLAGWADRSTEFEREFSVKPKTFTTLDQ